MRHSKRGPKPPLPRDPNVIRRLPAAAALDDPLPLGERFRYRESYLNNLLSTIQVLSRESSPIEPDTPWQAAIGPSHKDGRGEKRGLDDDDEDDYQEPQQESEPRLIAGSKRAAKLGARARSNSLPSVGSGAVITNSSLSPSPEIEELPSKRVRFAGSDDEGDSPRRALLKSTKPSQLRRPNKIAPAPVHVSGFDEIRLPLPAIPAPVIYQAAVTCPVNASNSRVKSIADAEVEKIGTEMDKVFALGYGKGKGKGVKTPGLGSRKGSGLKDDVTAQDVEAKQPKNGAKKGGMEVDD